MDGAGCTLVYSKNKLPICSVYGEVVVDYTAMKQCENQISFFDYGIFNDNRALLRTTKCRRTGCVLCGFGCHYQSLIRRVKSNETY